MPRWRAVLWGQLLLRTVLLLAYNGAHSAAKSLPVPLHLSRQKSQEECDMPTVSIMKDLGLWKCLKTPKPESEIHRNSWGDLLIRCPEGMEFSQPRAINNWLHLHIEWETKENKLLWFSHAFQSNHSWEHLLWGKRKPNSSLGKNNNSTWSYSPKSNLGKFDVSILW